MLSLVVVVGVAVAVVGVVLAVVVAFVVAVVVVVVAVVAFVVVVGAVLIDVVVARVCVLAMVAFSKPRRAGRDRCSRHCHRGCSRLKSVASCYSNVKRRRLYPQTRGHMEPESANVLQLSGGPTMALVRQN